MIKLDSLSRWQLLPVDRVLTLPGENQRRIRLNVNSPGTAKLYLVNDDGTFTFLAAPVGRDVIEFAEGGDVKIVTTDVDVSFYSAETEPTFIINDDDESFTRPFERAPRNPDLDYMMYKSMENMERRFAAQNAEWERRLAERNEYNRTNTDNSGTDAPADGSGRSESNAGSQSSAQPVGENKPAGTGDGSGNGLPVGDGGNDGPQVPSQPAV